MFASCGLCLNILVQRKKFQNFLCQVINQEFGQVFSRKIKHCTQQIYIRPHGYMKEKQVHLFHNTFFSYIICIYTDSKRIYKSKYNKQILAKESKIQEKLLYFFTFVCLRSFQNNPKEQKIIKKYISADIYFSVIKQPALEASHVLK